MNQKRNFPKKCDSLSDFHRLLGLPKPLHPMISMVDNSIDANPVDIKNLPNPFLFNFYKISFKENIQGRLKYGQKFYDFDEGGLFFFSPNQIISTDDHYGEHSGYSLIFHPDFLLTYPLARTIGQYRFFSYDVNEALHLSDKEKQTIITIFKSIADELNDRIDDFSQGVVITQIELLLNYASRYYKRQFITRKSAYSTLLEKFESVLRDSLKDENIANNGIPSVKYFADHLDMSPGYLSDLLRSISGQNAQQHIHNKLMEKAKEKLSSSNLSVSEIAYELGFEYPQSFSRLFKAKTKLSPLQFRNSFN